MLLNFLIAIMGAKYEEVMAKEDIVAYQTLAAINVEAMVYYAYYNDLTTSSGIVTIFAKEGEDVSNEYQSITSTIKRAMTKSIGDLREEMIVKMNANKAAIEDVKADVSDVKAAVKADVSDVKADVSDVKADVSDVKAQIDRVIAFLKVPDVEDKQEVKEDK